MSFDPYHLSGRSGAYQLTLGCGPGLNLLQMHVAEVDGRIGGSLVLIGNGVKRADPEMRSTACWRLLCL